jgi:hypothetical protein
MDARVRPTGDREPLPAWIYGVERITQRSFHRALTGLARPAVEARAVVLEGQLEVHDVT